MWKEEKKILVSKIIPFQSISQRKKLSIEDFCNVFINIKSL